MGSFRGARYWKLWLPGESVRPTPQTTPYSGHFCFSRVFEPLFLSSFCRDSCMSCTAMASWLDSSAKLRMLGQFPSTTSFALSVSRRKEEKKEKKKNSPDSPQKMAEKRRSNRPPAPKQLPDDMVVPADTDSEYQEAAAPVRRDAVVDNRLPYISGAFNLARQHPNGAQDLL